MIQVGGDLRDARSCSECGHRFGPEALFCPFDGTRLEATSWNVKTDKLLGETIDGRYQVIDLLGEGGMGKVYRVRHVALDRQFAMKVLRGDLASNADLAARFIQEARAAAKIRHPHVVSITDFGALEDGGPYFVMELLQGKSLGAILRAGGRMAPERAASIVCQIASAVAAAHAVGIVHRDLKPENIFIVPSNDPLRDQEDVRVVDFGAAKIAGSTKLTKAGIVFGTPHYMSPEQASGQPIDHRADVYALGIIMYEMFAGKVPFESDTYMGVLTQHMFVKPTPPSEANPDIAGTLGGLEEVTLRALEKEPRDRIGSMDELIEAIRAKSFVPLMRAQPLSFAPEPLPPPEPPRLSEIVAQPPSNDPLRFALAGAATALVVGLVIFFALRSRPAEKDNAHAPASAAVSGASAESAALAIAPSHVVPPPAIAPSPLPASSETKPNTATESSAVRVTSSVPAHVYEDGRHVGMTPFSVRLSTEPQTLVLRANGYADTEVVIDKSTNDPVRVELKRAPRSSPGTSPRQPPTPPAAAPQPVTPTVTPKTAAEPSARPQVSGDIDDPWAKRSR